MDQTHSDQEENNTANEGAEEQHFDGVTEQPQAAESTSSDQPVYQEEGSSESSNDAMEGMEPVSAETHEQSVADAEEQVSEASPLAASDELASVASELEAMEAQNFDVESTSIPVSSGSDPMQQIQENENAEQVAVEQMMNPEPVDSTESLAAPVELAKENVAPEPIVVEQASNTANTDVIEEAPVASGQGQMINDVIVPSATASAVAMGTAGSNAITGTPETTTTEQAIISGNKPSTETKPKTKKTLLILVVIVVTLLFGGAAVAAYLTSNKDKDSSTESSMVDTDTNKVAETQAPVVSTPAPGETVNAVALDDYKVACGTSGKVTNATAYAGTAIHPIVMFEKGSDGKYAQSVLDIKDKTGLADATKVTSGQLVGCISMKTGSEKKLKSCPITDTATKVVTNVDYYSTTYTVDVYEAKTGTKVTTFENVSVATDCPTTAVYDKVDPKIYAKYDLTTLEASLKPFVTKAL